MACFLTVTLAKVAKSALRTAQRAEKEFTSPFKAERNVKFSDENVNVCFQYFPISQFYLVSYKISITGENTVLKSFPSVNYVFCSNCSFS